MRSTLSSTVALLAASALAHTAAAQTGKGILTGTITDPKGAALQGVRVTLHPGTYSAVTSATGQYTIAGIDPGQYSMDTEYAGFANAAQQVTVSGGNATSKSVSLSMASTSQTVEVYAPREGGELEAISRTFNADNIINVLPADVITSLPNANVADAIGRLPDVTLERDEGEGKYVKVRGTEPRLTHTLLDGVTIATPEPVRQVKLDLIPADLVESVQINKTLQANMEGDGIGGTVDLRTKTATDRPTIYLEGTGGYTPILTGREAYQYDGTLGQRFGGDKKFGALLSGSYDWNGRGINDVEPGPALAGTYDQRDYRYFRSRWGIGGTLDLRQSDTSSFYLKYLYSNFKDFGDDWIYSPTINSWADSTTLTQGGPDGTISFTSLRRRPVQDIGGAQLGGNHVLHSALFHWDLNSSVGRTRDYGYLTQHFGPAGADSPLNNIPYALDLSNPLEPHLNPTNGVNIYDPTQYFYQGQSINNLYNPEVVLGFGASLAIPYTLAGHSSTFEFGGLFRNEHKFENLNTVNYAPTAANSNDPSLRMSNFLANDFADPNYYGGAYHEGPVTDVNAVNGFSAVGVSSATVGNSFNFLEKVSAGYIMNTTDIGRWRFNVGLRIEGTNDNSLGYIGSSSPTRSTGTTPNRVLNSYVNLLPSASVRYGLTPTQGIRLVYSRGLARPDFQDLIPFQAPPTGGTVNRTSEGNPYIRAEFGDDIDLLYENNIQRAGLLQTGFYYKHLSNPIVPVQSTTVLSNALNIVTGVGNAQSAHVYGIEVAYIQHFTSLPGLLSGLGLTANYGYTSSSVTFPPVGSGSATSGLITGPDRGPEGANPALIGQAPNSFNFSPTYDRRKLSVRLGMTYNEANISAYNYRTSNNGPITQGGAGGGPTGPNGDTYFYSHLQVDVQGSYRLPKGLTFVMYGLNLNNEVFGFYQGGPNYPIQREFYRQTVGGGLRWSPVRESR